jgi:hypothetical protein
VVLIGIEMNQLDFHHPGHRASKRRRLRVVGTMPRESESE